MPRRPTDPLKVPLYRRALEAVEAAPTFGGAELTAELYPQLAVRVQDAIKTLESAGLVRSTFRGRYWQFVITPEGRKRLGRP